MGSIKIDNISTEYCLKNVNLSINNGEFVVVLGHSGAGKSTLLNILAGFSKSDGDIYFGGRLMNGIPSQKREIGYLHQSIHLFPNLTVFDNIAFGLKAIGIKKSTVTQKVNEMMEMLKISHLKSRYPKNLSGGEKQRVGIARAIIKKPKILLLDEPLSSLDEMTAQSIRSELKMLQNQLNFTVVYVTHNKLDAQSLAHKVVVLNGGRIDEVRDIRENLYM